MSDLFPVQRGIHWPSCIDRSCEGCMQELVYDWTTRIQCAPALGVHQGCSHEERTKDE